VIIIINYNVDQKYKIKGLVARLLGLVFKNKTTYLIKVLEMQSYNAYNKFDIIALRLENWQHP